MQPWLHCSHGCLGGHPRPRQFDSNAWGESLLGQVQATRRVLDAHRRQRGYRQFPVQADLAVGRVRACSYATDGKISLNWELTITALAAVSVEYPPGCLDLTQKAFAPSVAIELSGSRMST